MIGSTAPALGRRTATGNTELILLGEAKVAAVLGGPLLRTALGTRRLEASGVLATADGLWVVFDNMPHLVRVDPRLRIPDPDAVVERPLPEEEVGFEDLARDPDTGHYAALIESDERSPGVLMARVWEFDPAMRPVRTRWLELPVPSANKGIEGLTYVRRDGVSYLLALSESNCNAGGRAGRRGGGGRVHVFTEHDHESWRRVADIELPTSLDAVDYSSISVRGHRIAVLSQCSSLLWTGHLRPREWDIMDSGRTYRLPRDHRGRTVYGTAEGVTWLTEDTVAIVSDRARKTRSRRVRAKDESIHLFRLP